MLDYDTNGLDEGLVRSRACHKTVNVRINFREHEYAKSGNVVPGVAGCIGISGKLCCDPGGTVVYEDTFKYCHVVWTDLVVDVQSSVDQEVEENVPDCGLIGGDVFNQGWIEGAVVPWVILKIRWSRRLSVGEQQVASNFVYEVYVPRVTISDIGSAVAEVGWRYPSEDSEVDKGHRWKRSRQGGTVHIYDEVIY